MIYNDNPRTIKDFDENKKESRKEAERETEAAKRRMDIEEQRRKQLKIDGKKREIDELTRNISSKESTLRRAELELDMLNKEKLGEERKLKEAEQKTKTEQLAQSAKKTKVAIETSKLKEAEREIVSLKNKLNKEEAELAKKINEAKILEKDIGILEEESKTKTKMGANEKSSLEMAERRISAITFDIQKINRELDGLKTDLRKKESELRALAA